MIATGAGGERRDELAPRDHRVGGDEQHRPDRGERVPRCHRDREHRADHDEVRDDREPQRRLR